MEREQTNIPSNVKKLTLSGWHRFRLGWKCNAGNEATKGTYYFKNGSTPNETRPLVSAAPEVFESEAKYMCQSWDKQPEVQEKLDSLDVKHLPIETFSDPRQPSCPTMSKAGHGLPLRHVGCGEAGG